MANTRKCKNCNQIFIKQRPLQACCDVNCAIANAVKVKKINADKEAKLVKRETKLRLDGLKTRAEYLKDAQRFFNIYIRLRDEHFPCISCQRHHLGQYHAGHYRTVGSAPHLRFDELNVHKQCAPCNNHLSGNIINYRKHLISKIGIGNLEKLEAEQEPKKYTIDEIKTLKITYKNKIKAIKNINV